jgi:trimethylamine--corrinoid protein Co-methyltransferase
MSWKNKMTTSNHVHPQIQVLDAEQIRHLHEQALKILATTGVRIDSPQVMELVIKAAGSKVVQGERIQLPARLVEWALQTAPSTVKIFDRRGNLAFQLGNDRTRFGIGVTTLFYQDPRTDQLTPFTRQNMQQLVRLGNALPLYDVISTVGIVQDVPPHLSDLFGTLDMLASTTKPLVVLVSDEQVFPAVIQLMEHLHGDLAEKPFIIPYFNPITPLVLNKGTLDKMQEAIRHRLPIIYSNYSMAGMSTPITAAGTLVLLLAELLAGLTVSQLMGKGTPVILGMLPAYFDMKTMVNFYDPLSLVLNLACAELMAHYKLPHCGTSGSGTGWGPDLLAWETYWMNHITSCIGKVGLAPFVGDNLGSKAFSPVNVVYAHEIIQQSLRFSNGFQMDTASLGLEEIDQVAPGGNYLSTPTTVENYRQAYYHSPIFPRLSLEKWQSQERPQAIDLLREYTCDLLEQMPAPEDYRDLLGRGEAWIKNKPLSL